MNIIIIFALIFVLLDQISKIIIINKFVLNKSLELIKGFFYITYTQNNGAAFSILNGYRIILIIVAVFILFILFLHLKEVKLNNKLENLSYSLIIGGAIGNLIDRIFRGYVIDFIDVRIFGYNYPVFNLADSFIVVGVIILIIISFRKEDKHDSRSRKCKEKNR